MSEPCKSGTIDAGRGLYQYYELHGQGNRPTLCIFNGVAMHTRIPTLVICGDHDMIIPRWVQRKACSVIPNSRLEVAQDCGHIVFLEQPDFFFEKMLGFQKAGGATGGLADPHRLS